jgi:hypothetical protein
MNIVFIVSIISVSFCFFLFFYFKWYIKRRTSASELLAEYRTEVYRLIAEIDAATDRDSQLVEDRIKKLKEILEETDRRISVYTREFDRSRTGEALYTSLGKGIRAALKTTAEPAPAPPASYAAPAPSLSIVRPNLEPAAVPPPAAQTITVKPPSKKQIRVQIDELANQGLGASEIASRLEISLAEVDLALNLISRNKKN